MLKLIDFGLAVEARSWKPLKYGGTLGHMAPELIDGIDH
jgi:hypothetical protein